MRNVDEGSISLPTENLAVAIYKTHADAEATIEIFQQSGFDMRKLSIVDQIVGISCDRWGHQCNGIDLRGVPKDSVLRYENALRVDKSIVVARGTPEELANGREIIDRSNPESVDEHCLSSASANPA